MASEEAERFKLGDLAVIVQYRRYSSILIALAALARELERRAGPVELLQEGVFLVRLQQVCWPSFACRSEFSQRPQDLLGQIRVASSMTRLPSGFSCMMFELSSYVVLYYLLCYVATVLTILSMLLYCGQQFW